MLNSGVTVSGWMGGVGRAGVVCVGWLGWCYPTHHEDEWYEQEAEEKVSKRKPFVGCCDVAQVLGHSDWNRPEGPESVPTGSDHW